MLNPSFYGTFGHTDTMVHEIGHSLGLYHVFRGISEVESCNDACLETEPSMETGDLCADTNPTPKYKGCHDPDPGNETCGCRDFTQTPFNNYMSYAGGPRTGELELLSLSYPNANVLNPAPVACRRLLHGLLHPEPGGQDALLPGPHLPDLASRIQASPGTHASASGGAASQFHHPGMVSSHLGTLLQQVKWAASV